MANIFEEDKKYIANTYARFPVAFVSGSGSVLTGEDGKRYIDLGSGIGVSSFGFADREWTEAVTKQASVLQHTSNLYYTSPCVSLAKALCEKTGMKKVFFGNSGAEANECAIKAARKYSAEKKGGDCFTIVTLINSFHGRTLTTLAATGQDVFHKQFLPLTPGFLHVAADDREGLCRTVEENKIAGIMIECVQCEGGVVPISREFADTVQRLAAENDIPLIVDEVQTGNGRTGSMYSYMQYGLTPDIVSTAKGLGGGLPIGAALLGDKVADVFTYGDHGSTFGGNPVCCAGALSVVNRLDEKLFSEVREKGRYIKEALEGADGVEGVSGMGLMIGVKTVKAAKAVVDGCLKRGVLCLTAKDKVRLLPALNIPADVLAEAVETLKAVCAEV